MRTYCIAQGTLLNAFWWPKWKGNPKKKRYMYRSADSLCWWWLQPWNEKTLAPWKKSYDQPRQHIKKQKHHFADKDQYSQSYHFSSSHVQMWELYHEEGWVQKNWSFRTIVLEKTLLRASWTARRLNQSVLKEISPEYSLEGLMLKLRLQYPGHLVRRADSSEKNLMLERLRAEGKEGNRGWDGWMALLIQWTGVWSNSGR